MPQAIIALGSNIGNKEQNIKRALEKMKERGLRVTEISPLIETEPYGYQNQDTFLNGACIVKTNLSPLELLKLLQDIEQEMGRVRKIRWGPRNIDLDIIFYDDLIMDENELKIPHPDAHNRLFVLGPIYELAPFFVHPIYNKTVAQLYKELAEKE
ncbi:MAG: 2-amino-4-hydroxy-6-hydroxymethyldihydropteridine diphosphokinase [Firmicutes bacterium]|nr:2-amino-4-hydroxy-6-hydroxymethyldihydropteridine diphosphokinase [Bacillota bacterium]